MNTNQVIEESRSAARSAARAVLTQQLLSEAKLRKDSNERTKAIKAELSATRVDKRSPLNITPEANKNRALRKPINLVKETLEGVA